MKKLLCLMTSVMLLAMALPARAANAWPDKTITLIIPYAAGGVADASGRLLAHELEKELKVNIIAKNVAGATGSLGAGELAKAKPDGYTLGWLPPGPAVGMPNMRKLPYSRDDLLPVALLFDEKFFLTTSKKMPWKDVNGMIADVKANPDKYVMGSPGRGGAVHLAAYTALKNMGLKCRYVPERSNADVLKAIAGGTTHFHASSANEVKRFDLKPLVYLDKERSSIYPDVPTIFEAGYEVPVFSNWMGLYAPNGTPQEIIKKLSDAVGKIAESPEFKATAEKMGCTILYLPADKFAEFYVAQYDLYKSLMQELLKTDPKK